MLDLTPGVFADTSAQRERRISIRGSGLNSGFERRGLTVLRDGVPISRASGATEFQEIDPLTIRYLEVFKGANGLQFGAASLGGAVNIVSPTGRTAVLELPGGSRAAASTPCAAMSARGRRATPITRSASPASPAMAFASTAMSAASMAMAISASS